MTSFWTLVFAIALAGGLSAVVRFLPLPAALPVPNRGHKTVTPATGGIALFIAFMIALQPPLRSGAISDRYTPLIVVAGAAFALGLLDDARQLSIHHKIAGQ